MRETSGADEWVRDRLLVLSSSGSEMICECPTCGKDRLYINPEKGMFICYVGCWSGALAYLVSVIDKVSLARAAELIAVPMPRNIADVAALLNRPLDLTDDEVTAQPLPREFVSCLDARTGLMRVPGYAEDALSDPDEPGSGPSPGRGLEDCTLLKHGLGYAEEGRYRDRLIAPIHCAGNYTFLGRLMGSPSAFAWRASDGKMVTPPRYLHPKGANISQFLYWYDHLPEGVDVVLTEGIYDAIRLLSFGLYAVASFGKALSEAQLKLLVRKRPKSVSVYYDANAGINAATDGWSLKSRIHAPVFVVTPPGNHDPDSYGYFHGRKATKALIANGKPVTSRLDALSAAIAEIRTSR